MSTSADLEAASIHDNDMFTVLARRLKAPSTTVLAFLAHAAALQYFESHPVARWKPGKSRTRACYRSLYSTGDLTEHALIDRSRRRSLGFLDWEQETWSCFLVTFVGRDGQWHGHLMFRPQDSDGESDEVRTADIFIEASEAEIDHKARDSAGRFSERCSPRPCTQGEETRLANLPRPVVGSRSCCSRNRRNSQRPPKSTWMTPKGCWTRSNSSLSASPIGSIRSATSSPS